MRLATLAPSLPAELTTVLALLAQLDPPVLNSRKLLFTPSQALVKSLAALPADVLGLAAPRDEDVKALQKEVRRVEGPPMVQGGAAHDEELTRGQSRSMLSVGLVEVDTLLSNLSGVIEVSGPGGSGKTLFVLHLAIQHLLVSPGTRVLWVDTGGAFSAERALAILQAVDSYAIPDKVLDRLEVRAILDLDSFAQTVAHVSTDLAAAPSRSDGNAADDNLLMIVDPVTELYGPNISSGSQEVKATMVKDMHALYELSYQHRVDVLIVNSAVPCSSTGISRLPYTRTKPALGTNFSFLTQATLWLEEWPASTAAASAAQVRQVVVQLSKNKTRPSGGFAAFATNGVSLERVPT